MHNVIGPVKRLMEASGQKFPDQSTMELYGGLILEELDELADAVEAGDEVEQFDACLDIIWVLTGFMIAKGWFIQAGWDEVARSNLSKIDPVSGVCIKREDGKILKPPSYSPPNLEQFLK